VSFIVCVVMCAGFCLSVVCYFVGYVYSCVLCLIVVPLPEGKNPFAVQLNNNNLFSAPCSQTPLVCVRPLISETKFRTHTKPQATF
jgi:hypothetical protein